MKRFCKDFLITVMLMLGGAGFYRFIGFLRSDITDMVSWCGLLCISVGVIVFVWRMSAFDTWVVKENALLHEHLSECMRKLEGKG
jgi:protein-S-isoprenylcysteine O-methyltransferase Ste14